MTKQVLLRDAHRYYCYQDEKHFFDWLETIRGVIKVVGSSEGLTVHFASAPLSRESWGDLLGLFARYGLDMRPLQALVTKKHEPWLRDPIKYWHAAMWQKPKRAGGSRSKRPKLRKIVR